MDENRFMIQTTLEDLPNSGRLSITNTMPDETNSVPYETSTVPDEMNSVPYETNNVPDGEAVRIDSGTQLDVSHSTEEYANAPGPIEFIHRWVVNYDELQLEEELGKGTILMVVFS